jgi:hypothetical protein
VDEASAELSKIIDLAASRSFKKKKVKEKNVLKIPKRSLY